jgi:hypothetical protein
MALAQTATVNGIPNQSVSAATCLGANSVGVINGISYTNCYTGSTFDVRANAALLDAVNSANGNTTGIVDSSYEPRSQTQSSQINVGLPGGSSTTVEWKLGASLFVNVGLTVSTGTVNTSGTTVTYASGAQFPLGMTGNVMVINSVVYTVSAQASTTSLTLSSSAGTQTGVSYGYTPTAVNQYPNTIIKCDEVPLGGGCEFSSTTASNNIQQIYFQNGNGTGTFRVDGLYFVNRGNPGNMGSTYICKFNGGVDGSSFENSECEDVPISQSNTTAVAYITNTCCHRHFTNDTFDSEVGGTAIDLETPGEGIDFHNTTANSHGATASGNPNILCHDTGPGTNSGIAFSGYLYMEGQLATMSAPWIQDNGCQSLNFNSISAGQRTGGSGTTSPIIDISSVFDTTLNIGNVVASSAGGTWSYPVTIVKQHNTTNDCGSPPCNVAVTDSAGNSPGYHSRTTQFNNLTVGGVTTLAHPAISAFTPNSFALNGVLDAGETHPLTPVAASTAVQIEYNITAKPTGCSTFPSVGIVDVSNSNAVICSISVNGSAFHAFASCSSAVMTAGHTLEGAITTAAVGCTTNTGTAYVDLQYFQNTN